jgi:hypothetical protein
MSAPPCPLNSVSRNKVNGVAYAVLMSVSIAADNKTLPHISAW